MVADFSDESKDGSSVAGGVWRRTAQTGRAESCPLLLLLTAAQYLFFFGLAPTTLGLAFVVGRHPPAVSRTGSGARTTTPG